MSSRRRLLVDLTPLRAVPDYRRLLTAELVSTLGGSLTIVAVAFQVYTETHSSFQVGAVSLAQLFPLIIGALIGGSVGDAVDRRTIMWLSTLCLSLTSVVLAINSVVDHPAIWLIYLVSAVAGGIGGFSDASAASSSATLVGPKHLSAAAALNQIVFQIGVIVGPAIAGIIISGAGLRWVFILDAISLVASALLLRGMQRIPPVEGASRPGLASIAEGGRFLKASQVLKGIFIIDINAMVFGMPRALFPALALGNLHVGVGGLGYLYSAPAVGAFIGSVGSGWVGHVRRRGLAVVVAVMVWGGAIAAFGLVHWFWLALICLAVAGWADVVSAVLRSTILQTTVPEEFRSRLSSIQMAVVQGGPRLGDLEAGSVASVVSTQFSVVSGGVACIAGALITAAALPGFTKHERSEGT